MNTQQNILKSIENPKDLKKINVAKLQEVCDALRSLIIKTMSNNPGHLGASLGTVELAVGLHYVFDTLNEPLVWDVGHQAYAHKILTGRKNSFENIRNLNGISGFPSIQESEYDSFGTGHSSTSISAVLGMACASLIKGNFDGNHIAVIGDGALTGGMAFEALNHLADTKANVLVIVNDNNMSIDDNVGGLQKHLNSITDQNNVFTQLGIPYYGTINGNSLQELLEALTFQKTVKGPRVLHIKTVKGYGYHAAEDGDTTLWHAPGKFDIETGKVEKNSSETRKTYQDIVSKSLCTLGTLNSKVAVVTPAMASGSKLLEFKKLFPNRFFDVGIAEQHAVTFSAGLAKSGTLPFCVVYSTFLQRGYDQLIHDVALQNLPVVFLIDRAGFVGNDGATHHGAFDLAFLNCIPNMRILAPMDEQELEAMLLEVSSSLEAPVAIRYPRGTGALNFPFPKKKLGAAIWKIQTVKNGNEHAVISIGAIGNTVKTVLKDLPHSHYDLRCVKPLDIVGLKMIFDTHNKVTIIEDGIAQGGIGSQIISWAAQNGYSNAVKLKGYPDKYIQHGSMEELYASIGMGEIGLRKLLIYFDG